jgi:hypothetical protein
MTDGSTLEAAKAMVGVVCWCRQNAAVRNKLQPKIFRHSGTSAIDFGMQGGKLRF